VKIADFGLTRSFDSSDYIYHSSNETLPFRWAAPESITSKVFSFSSDIWSFGVVLWEMMSRGERPDDIQVVTGDRLKRPSNTPDEIWDLMNMCWYQKPQDRPSFKVIYTFLQRISSSIAVE